MSKQYIEREALLDVINEVWERKYERCGLTYKVLYDLYRMIIKRINRAPTSDVAPVRHGKWIKTPYYEVHRCSICNKPSNTSKGLHNYCPECGAKMDGGNSNDKNQLSSGSTNKDALIELIHQADASLFGDNKPFAEVYADHLIENNVRIVVQCKNCIYRREWIKNGFGEYFCRKSGLWNLTEDCFCHCGEETEKNDEKI